MHSYGRKRKQSPVVASVKALCTRSVLGERGLFKGRARYHPLSERVTRPTLSSRS
jgi:hypothetical protein